MNEQTVALMQSLGADIPGAMERFMNNEALYLRFLYTLLENTQFDELQQQINNNNQTDALNVSHNLKSLTGNLSLTKLHELFTEQVRLIRAGEWDAAVGMMDGIMTEFQRVIELLKEANLAP